MKKTDKSWECNCKYTKEGKRFGKCLRCFKLELEVSNRVRTQTLQEIKKKVEERINYIEKYKLNSDYTNGFSGIESGECCKKCKMTNPNNPLQALVRCTNPFQIKEQYGKKLCQCHIPFRKVATASELILLKEIKSDIIYTLKGGLYEKEMFT